MKCRSLSGSPPRHARDSEPWSSFFRTEYPPEDLAGWLRQHRLENVLFNLPPGNFAAGDRGLAAVPGREAEFREAVARGIEYARHLGTPRVHAMAGIQPPHADRTACREVFVRNLRYAASELAAHSLTLVIEPINTRDMPGFLLTTQAEAQAICHEVGAANLLMQMDLYHAQIMEGDLATKLRKYLSGVSHVQIAGVPDRHEPDEGEVNYDYLLQLVDDLGYAGWIGCEYRPRGRTEEGLGWMRKWARP